MAAGGEQTRSAHARDVSLGARIRLFFYFVWFVFINHIFQFYYELCIYCNILDIYLS